MRRRFRPAIRASTIWAALVAVLCAANLAMAAGSLARLVPATAGLCIEANDLAGALARLQNGRLGERAAANRVLGPALARLLGQIAGARTKLDAQLGTAGERLPQLLSGDVLVAVWPEKSASGEGTGLLLVRCPNEELLAKVAEHLVERQRQAGRLSAARQLTFKGRSVEVQTIATNGAGGHVSLAVAGSLAVASTSGALLDEVLAAELDEPLSSPLAELPAYQAAAEQLNPSAAVRVFLNPRRWDEQMHALKRPAAGRKALVHDGILALWEASSYLAGSLAAGDDLKLELFLACQQSRLREPLRAALSSFSGASPLADRLPSRCLAAAIGRLDVGRMLAGLVNPAVLEHYEIHLPSTFEWAAATALAGSLGPDFAMAVLPPSKADPARGLPVHWVAAMATHSIEPTSGGPSTTAWLLPWIRETLRVWDAAGKTSQHARPQMKVVEQGGQELTAISGWPRLPAGEIVYLAEHKSMLWLGNSASITAAAAKALPPATKNRRYELLHHPRITAPSDLLLVDLAEIRKLAGSLGLTSDSPPAGKLGQLLALTGLADALLLEVQCDAAGTAIALRIACD